MQPAEQLLTEQAYLEHARRCLAAMRASVERLKAFGADRIATEILEAKIARRLVALQDDPEVPLFFGRIDVREPKETFHIGRRHVRDEEGDPVVVDWRADISRRFYRATGRDPMGLSRRRRFGFQRGLITAMEDEPLELGREAEGLSPLVSAEIERPRTGPMRDIVATIQPEQDEIVRAGLAESICVQGGPGTGKTAVGLHRAAYLLYAFAGQLRHGGVLVVGPNEAFIRYISQVLPALGEVDVEQKPLEELLGTVPIRVPKEEPAVATLKHDPRMAEVIRRAILSRLAPSSQALAVTIGMTGMRIQPRRLAGLRHRVLQRGLPYEAGRKMFRQVVAGELLAAAESVVATAGRSDVTAALRSSKQATNLLEALWPKQRPVEIVWRLLSDGDFLAGASESLLAPEERRRLLWTTRTTRARAPWSPEDVVLLDEAAGFIERPRRYDHVVVDEAQDLSPMQLRAIGRRCQRSVTLLGDLAQATTPWASSNWDEALGHLGVRAARVETLQRAFRIQASVLRLANRLLPHTAPDLPPAVAVRDAPDALALVQTSSERLGDEVAAQVEASLERPGSIGVIVPSAAMENMGRSLDERDVRWSGALDVAAGHRVTLLRPEEAKGLEFDMVVLVEPAAIASPRPMDLRLLYIALTRAVQRLVIVHARPLPPELAA